MIPDKDKINWFPNKTNQWKQYGNSLPHCGSNKCFQRDLFISPLLLYYRLKPFYFIFVSHYINFNVSYTSKSNGYNSVNKCYTQETQSIQWDYLK